MCVCVCVCVNSLTEYMYFLTTSIECPFELAIDRKDNSKNSNQFINVMNLIYKAKLVIYSHVQCTPVKACTSSRGLINAWMWLSYNIVQRL